ncbi:MAG: hypothetical protein CVU17_07355 [Betaproteobacteria bacterium HGW-Betaproteobacteria-11]|nr:MAG: hypothetical protein CVU17_07355 [Betaproteobacteria bacterium HGW-Betaproteobacteria-11]
MTADNDTANLPARLIALRTEHRLLDEAISRLTDDPPEDELQVRRLKKRKLALKDKISRLELVLDPDPDEYA